MPTAPISLYIDVESDRSVELEVAARASIEFAAGLREIAYIFDPSLEFRIELLRADEGSNWIKARLRWVRGLGFAQPTLAGISFGATIWFLQHVADKTFDAAWDHAFGEQMAISGVPPEQVDEIARRAAKAAVSEVAAEHFHGVYRALERDRAVTGVGVAPSHSEAPTFIVPRAEFHVRAYPDKDIIAPGKRRIVPSKGDFVIIRPVLKEGGGVWRLRGPGGEFSARIADEDFYAAILAGSTDVPFAAEIHITADMEAEEQMTEQGVWKPISRRIIKVHSIRRPPTQPPLIGSASDR